MLQGTRSSQAQAYASRLEYTMPIETASCGEQTDDRLTNPAAHFATPEALLDDSSLSREQKIAALRCWAYDAAESCVAVEEGMRDGETDLLRRVLLALGGLGERVDVEHVGPSKQHGLPTREVRK